MLIHWAGSPAGGGSSISSARAEKKAMSLISIVIPVYNEQDCLPALFERLERLQA